MRGLSIGELAREAGVNLETIRYYERIGLMPAPVRTAGGHRSYAEAHARRLRFIRRSRELGFHLDSVRTLLALAEPGQSSCAEVLAISRAHLDEVRAKIADLVRLEAMLAKTARQCSGRKVPICPVLEMLDRRD